MKEIFVPQRFASKSEVLLKHITEILERYASQGLSLSVRQLYYQLVTINAIKNNHAEYKSIVDLVSNARLAGRIDWDAIVDRARALLRPRNWEDAPAAVRWVHEQFQMDKWRNQDWHVEVMVEKQALEGVLEGVCVETDVAFCANKGYSSQTMMYYAGKRLQRLVEEEDKKLLIIYLGDHDPSGMDMTRDIRDRLALFSRKTEIRVARVALNMPQIRRYNPPPNPTKQTDARTPDYNAQFGDTCWELDALEPTVIVDLVRREILKVRDEAKWEMALKEEATERARILDAAGDLENPFDKAKLAKDIRDAEKRLADSRLREALAEKDAYCARATAHLRKQIERLKAKKTAKTTTKTNKKK